MFTFVLVAASTLIISTEAAFFGNFQNYLTLSYDLVRIGSLLDKSEVQKCTILIVGQSFELDVERPHISFDLTSSRITYEATNLTNIRYSHSCTIGSYFVEKLCDLEYINDWWIWRIPGGIYFSYHFIFPTRAIAADEMQAKNRVMDLMHNFVIVIPSTATNNAENEFELGAPGVFWEQSLEIIGTWNTATGALNLLSQSEFFLDRWRNYRGAEIIVARNLGLTESEIDSYREDFEFVTPLTPLYLEIYNAMNATFKTIDPDPLVFGTKINGSWNGALKLIHDGEAHLTIFMGMNSYLRSELLVWSPMLFSRIASFS